MRLKYEKYAPENTCETIDVPKSASWIIVEIKNATVTKEKLFQKRIAEPIFKSSSDINKYRTNLLT